MGLFMAKKKKTKCCKKYKKGKTCKRCPKMSISLQAEGGLAPRLGLQAMAARFAVGAAAVVALFAITATDVLAR